MEKTIQRIIFNHYWLHIHDKRNTSYGDFLERVIIPKLATPLLRVFRSHKHSIRVLNHAFINGRLTMVLQIEREDELALEPLPDTHVMIDPAHRQVLVQETPSRLSGAELAEFITFASTLFEPGTETEVFFPPMLRKEDILAFFNYSALERIASVSMEVVRPNHGWTDYYNLLTSFADESNASIAKVEMSAPRNRSLQQQTGIIAIFLSLVTATPGLLQHFRIHTVLTGQHDLTVLDLHDYRIRTEEQLDLSTNPGSASQQIQQRLIEMEPSEKVREEPSPVPA